MVTGASAYHSRHRHLVDAEREYSFRVANFTSLLARAMGVEHEDRYRRYKLMGRTEDVLREVLATVGHGGHSLEELRSAVDREFGG